MYLGLEWDGEVIFQLQPNIPIELTTAKSTNKKSITTLEISSRYPNSKLVKNLKEFILWEKEVAHELS